MEITGGNPFAKINSYVRQVRGGKSGSDAATNSSSGEVLSGDRVELSPKAKKMQEAKRILGTIPDIREEKVAQIRKQIEDGTYQIDSQKIAEKMVTESLINQFV